MKKTFSRLSCVLLAVVMLVGLLPAGMVAFAADAEPVSSVESVEYDFNGLESGVNVYDACVEYNPSTNPNWAFFDMSVDYKNITSNSYKRWAGYTSKGESHNGGHGYLKIADLANYTASNGTMYNTPDAWTALKFKSERPLVPGKYTISFNVVDSGPARTSSGNEKRENRLLTAYVAEYVKGQDEGSYYKDNGIQVMSQKITHEEAEPAKRDPKSYAATTEFNVTDPNAEFVLFLELEGLEVHLDSFTIKKTNDFATSLTTTFTSFSGAKIVHDKTYAEYNGRNWAYVDAIDYIKGQTSGTSYAGNISSSSGLNIKSGFTSDELTSDGTIPAWIALKYKPANPLQPGKYEVNLTSYSSATAAPVRVYIAEYDSAGSKAAADYATEENLAFVGTTVGGKVATADTGTDHSFVLKNPNAELIVIFRLGTETSQLRMTKFNITYMEDASAETPATPATTTYDFQETTVPTIKNGARILDLNSYVATGRNWKWLTADPDFLISLKTRARFGRMSGEHISIDSQPAVEAEKNYHVPNAWHSFVLDAPKAAGIYDLTVTTLGNSNTTLGDDPETDSSAIWVADYKGINADTYMTDENLMNSDEKRWVGGSVLGKKYISVGEDTDELIFLVRDQGTGTNSKIVYKQIKLEPIEVVEESTELRLSKSFIAPGATATAGLYINGEKPLMHSAVDYSVASGSDVVEISDTGVITAKAEGEAVITATYGDITKSASIRVTSKNLLTGDVNVYVHSIVNGVAGDGKAGITTEDGIAIGEVNTVARGTEITLTADTVDGAKFSHWQTASGTFLSSDTAYNFTANTNTVVVGVYENVEDAADGENVTVSFYDGFGGLITKVTNKMGTAFLDIAADVAEKNFRGYIFKHWESVEGVLYDDTPIKKNTIAVAQYTEEPTKYTVTINDGESVEYAYNAEVTASATDPTNFSYWERGGKIVSYEKSYTFNVWGNTVLTEVTGVAVEKAPIVILEKDGNEYMVEYSLPDDCSFVEAGIVSGSVTPTVGSFNKKASSKRLLENHGQFTAKTTDEVVRGYVIYSDADGDLVVAYSE